jgi:hypothetical protein
MDWGAARSFKCTVMSAVGYKWAGLLGPEYQSPKRKSVEPPLQDWDKTSQRPHPTFLAAEAIGLGVRRALLGLQRTG